MLCVFAAGAVFVFLFEQEVEDGRGWTGQQTKADLLRAAFTNYQLEVLPVFDFYTVIYLILHKSSTGCPRCIQHTYSFTYHEGTDFRPALVLWQYCSKDNFTALSLSRGTAICQYRFFYQAQVQSLSCLVPESVSTRVEFCSKFYMVSLLLRGFVKIDIWISLNGYLELSKLMHWFSDVITCICQGWYVDLSTVVVWIS